MKTKIFYVLYPICIFGITFLCANTEFVFMLKIGLMIVACIFTIFILGADKGGSARFFGVSEDLNYIKAQENINNPNSPASHNSSWTEIVNVIYVLIIPLINIWLI